MARMRTEIYLLTKHIVAKYEKVNVVGHKNNMKIKILNSMRNLTTYVIKEVSRTITHKIMAKILEIQVELC